MKKETKRRIAIALTLVLALGIIAGCGSSNAKVDGTKDNAKSEPKKQDLTNLAIGTVIDLDGVKVSVDSIAEGPQSWGQKPTKEVTVTYKNDSKKSASFNSFDWKSEDANGVRKDTTIVDGDTLSSGDLAPGGTVTGKVFFEDTDITKIVYVPSFFSGDDELIFWNAK